MGERVHYEPPWPGAEPPAYDYGGCKHDEWQLAVPFEWSFPSPLGAVFKCVRCGHRRSGLGLMSGIDDMDADSKTSPNLYL